MRPNKKDKNPTKTQKTNREREEEESLTIHQTAYALLQNSFTVFAKPAGQNLQYFQTIQLLQQPHHSIAAADGGRSFLGDISGHDFHGFNGQPTGRKQVTKPDRRSKLSKLRWKNDGAWKYIYIYIWRLEIYIYIYIYIERERERERE